MAPPPRKLVVEVVSARNLMPKDGSGSASAYCTLDYDGNRRKTNTKMRDLNPTWGQKFDFAISDIMNPGALEINIYNERKGGTRRNNFLGRVTIKVADVVKQGQEALQWLRLDKRGLFSHVKGELGLKVWYEDPKPAPPPPQEAKPKPPPKEEAKPPPGPGPEDKPPEQPKNLSTVAPAEFQIRDVVQRNLGAAVEYNHNYDLVEPMTYLYVRVVKARKLAAKDANGTSDPYVKIAVGDANAKSKIIPKNLDPEWNQVFAFSKEKLHGPLLEISVWDADMVGPDDFLGALSFELAEIPTRKPPESPLAPQWYKLEERPGKTRVKGDIMLALWMGTQADEAFQEAWQSDTGGHAHFRSKVYLSPKLWYLRVNIIEAQDLLPPDKGRLPEPFVEVQLGSLQILRVHKGDVKGVNPQWNKDLMFVVAEPFEELLVILVKDRVGNKEEIMGQVKLPLSPQVIHRRIDGRSVPSTWHVLDSTDKNVFRGRIHLRLSFDGGYHVLDESPDFSSCNRPTAKQLWKASLGVLELGIIGANNLLPMHNGTGGRGNTDAYCVAKYGQKWVRTRTITESFNPKWNEQYTWEVYDPCTVLTVGVFDNRHVNNGVAQKAAGVKDTPIGKIRIRLSTLESDRVYTNAYPLLVVTASGIKKMGELECSVRFSCISTVNCMQAYLQPPLPRMHYFHPLELGDVENLRIAAMNLVASRLARSEPPLRQEVVQFMLDTESHRWSMRRSKANYFRIANVLHGVFAVAKWFEDICRWKNPVTTVLVHILYLILVWYPELMLPTVFLYMFLIGAWNYRLRSRSPPFMDSKLSQGGEEPIRDLDELEEEFNVVTGNKTEQVLKQRYERLRGFAGRIQNFLGSAATQGERLQALLSWRDPRATSIFVTFCLVAAIVLYVTPFRVVAVLLGVYVLRHPKFRDPLPAVPLNFFRRLPSLSDRIL
ncbi:hypothetical protein MPTK1_6g00440 [Marchantia polymorpha subsp. ruderalis]|uniref:C2 domain-containing protein n=2 Tax=Marchantia polymorpha TaxID=3197 RepID=A0AAF6BM25_MARPO|nr:hypothetical protein MARPO_0104s0022 [Marchantia polymorpha]BBN13059.1 hypothetical protein Mp_6g00440 [Marchantia polymorpha subsp. ruderalis]|eukprot:PTQ31986.1 hypothetical protein MARPO_0104s0022 [Marchantia polymorpha]